MSVPSYMAERAYTCRVAIPRPLASADYVVASPEDGFEQQVYDLFMTAEAHLQSEEYGLALDAFEELQLLILNTDNPTMPVDPGVIGVDKLPKDPRLVDILAEQAATMLRATPPVKYAFPASLVADESALPPDVLRQLKPLTNRGLVVTSFHDDVLTTLDRAAEEVGAEDWEGALELYQEALATVPEDDGLVRGALLHDMAVLADKADEHGRAVELGAQSLELMGESGDVEAHVTVLDTMVGVYDRGGEPDLAEQVAAHARDLRTGHNLDPVTIARPVSLVGVGTRIVMGSAPPKGSDRSPGRATNGRRRPGGAAPEAGSAAVLSVTGAAATTAAGSGSVLIASQYVADAEPAKSYIVQNVDERVELDLARTSTLPLLEAIRNTDDLSLVTQFAATPVQMVAYLPHMYFFVIPMAIGDCLAGLGSFEDAEQTYRDTLLYPYINLTYEAVELWSKLADVYLAMGDAAYRAARDDTTAFRAARTHYEQIVRADGTLDLASALYADATFAGMRTRVQAVLAAADPAATGENPDVVTRVLAARVNLDQIAAGLNFFGLAPEYLAPFGWEYLQTTARYFAQSASQIEQRYILFKSTAENEELRRDQLDQQADVAAQSVVLEERGLAEAQAGVDVGQASVDYAEAQLANAIEARAEFEGLRWALFHLQMAEALTAAQKELIGRKNNDQSDILEMDFALMSLALTRTLISHDAEAARLDRAVEEAEAAKQVAEEQLALATARIGVAEQRIVIAQLQQAYAEANRDYLDMREFSAHLWFDLAAQARALTRRYLDLAIELALLTERAYNAETERGLRLIRYDYTDAGVGELLGADRLLADVDAFTADYITTVKSKKLPVKKVISIADAYPTAFQQLRTRGLCMFPTEFANFDREHPGMYLCKLRNVELALVGITSAATLAGSLRNVGVSSFRSADGSIVARNYPPDVMPLSQYSVRGDALLFRFNPNDLRAFELGGIETLWQLELPPGANRFDLGDLLDVQLILYYDGYFSPSLEASVKAALPTSGASARTISMAGELPDELFFLTSTGEAEINFTDPMFPANQRDRRRTDVMLKLTGDPATVGDLTLRLASREHGEPLMLTTDAAGEVDGTALAPLQGEPLLDSWTVRITAEDNPNLVRDGRLELDGLRDFLVFLEFTFDYR